jgi:hypothetical protein
MAITTTQQLVSALPMSLPFPDGTATAAGELQHILWQYAGVLAGPLVPPPHAILVRGGTLTASHGTTGVLRATSVGKTDVLVP